MSELLQAAMRDAQADPNPMTRAQRADEYRRPVSPLVEIVDTKAGKVVGTQLVTPIHHEPGGYGESGQPPEMPPGYEPVLAPVDPMTLLPPTEVPPAEVVEAPPVVEQAPPPVEDPAVAILAQELGTVVDYFDPTNEQASMVPLPEIPEAVARRINLDNPQPYSPFQPPVPDKPPTEAEFELLIGGETQEFMQEYADVLIQDDVMVFVAKVGKRLWLPKQSKSAEIAVKVRDSVHKITVLPVQFTHDQWQYGLAMILESRTI